MEQSFDVLRDIALVMTAAGVAVAVMARLGQSAVMGYLLAGMVVGPFLLPALSVTHTEFIRRLADLGLILVLYSIGVEFGWHRFRRLGAVVIVIALAEVTILLAAGYAAARLLGWAPIDGIFLGAAISVTSSAVVVKMLRDSGRLDTPAGRLIVGTSIVEDFVAVILLTVLSGIAATGTASLVDVGELLVKIAMFAFATIVFGVLFVPRIMDIVARWGSQEASLVTSLALGFGLALVAHSLELSPAAGAFMIGAVLGDTRHARNLEQMVAPLRDVFAAVFFVSVGTLVDLTLVLAFIGPALVVTALFIVIKVLANAFATLLTGNSEDTALRVGLGMPSMGEFSVALAKTGADRGVVNPILYPVVTVTAVLTSFTYPYIFRAQDRAARFAAARSSRWVGPLTLQLRSLFGWMRLPRVARGPGTTAAMRQIAVSAAVALVLLAAGPFVLRVADGLAITANVSSYLVATLVGAGIFALCVPSFVGMWLGIRKLSRLFVERAMESRARRFRAAETVLGDMLGLATALLIAAWSLPLVFDILALGGILNPIPWAAAALALAFAGREVRHIHAALTRSVESSMLGGEDADATTTGTPPRP